MRNLILFIIRYHALLLFVLLEFLSFYLIVQHNDRQQKSYLTSSNQLTGSFYKRLSTVKSYVDLRSRNDVLLEENKEIRQRIFDLQILNDSKIEQEFVNDTSNKQRFELLPARVINNSTARVNNYLTIDKGAKEKVELNTGVIGERGIVGIVDNSSANFSTVISLLNTRLSISAMIERNGFFGNLKWDGDNPKYVVLEAIPKHADIALGDKIITSGYSSMFPKGILIGKITEFDVEDGSNFYDIKVRLENDLGSLKHVYIVKDLMKKELTTLESQYN